MKQLYKDIYLESNGDIILMEKNLLGESKMINLTEKAREAK